MFWMPAGPTQTKGGFRGKDGWFNEHEEKIMVNRVLRDDPSKGSMHNRQAVTPKMLWYALWDYDMWPIYVLGLVWGIPNTPATNYITLQLKSLGFGTFETNLLTIPAYVLFILNLLFWTWVSERFNQRMLLGVVTEVWCLVLLIALEVLPADASTWGRWVILVLLIGAPYVHAIIVAITSRNAGSVRTRTVATALYNMTVQASSIISNNVGSLRMFEKDSCILTWSTDLPRERQAIIPHRQQGADCTVCIQYSTVHIRQVLLYVAQQVIYLSQWLTKTQGLTFPTDKMKPNGMPCQVKKRRHIWPRIRRLEIKGMSQSALTLYVV